MQQPERERLRPEQAAALRQSTQRYAEWVAEQDKAARVARRRGIGAVVLALVVAVVAAAILVLVCLLVATRAEAPASGPLFVSTTPAPCRTGGVQC
jgi:type VI protein secretion system component VasF